MKDFQALQDPTEKSIIKPYVLPLPFPQKHKQKTSYKQFVQFLNMFKNLHINIPFAEALAQMPKYAKFMKEILRNKKTWGSWNSNVEWKMQCYFTKQASSKA